jgi:hypothetical protein
LFFWGLAAWQAVDVQEFTLILPFQKKSCLKTYGRFLSFWGIWQNRCVNIKKSSTRDGSRKAGGQPAGSPMAQSGSGVSPLFLFKPEARTEQNRAKPSKTD